MENARRIPRKQSTGALINGIQVGEERLTFREIDTSRLYPLPLLPSAASLRLTRTSRQNFSLQNPSPPHRQIVHSDKGNLISSRDNPWSLSKHRSGRVSQEASPPSLSLPVRGPEGWSERMNPIDGSGLRPETENRFRFVSFRLVSRLRGR